MVEQSQASAAIDILLGLLERAAPYLKVVMRNDINGYGENNPSLYWEVLVAIAQAKCDLPDPWLLKEISFIKAQEEVRQSASMSG